MTVERFEWLPVSRPRGGGCIVFRRIPTPVFVTPTVKSLLSQSVAMYKRGIWCDILLLRGTEGDVLIYVIPSHKKWRKKWNKFWGKTRRGGTAIIWLPSKRRVQFRTIWRHFGRSISGDQAMLLLLAATLWKKKTVQHRYLEAKHNKTVFLIQQVSPVLKSEKSFFIEHPSIP